MSLREGNLDSIKMLVREAVVELIMKMKVPKSHLEKELDDDSENCNRPSDSLEELEVDREGLQEDGNSGSAEKDGVYHGDATEFIRREFEEEG